MTDHANDDDLEVVDTHGASILIGKSDRSTVNLINAGKIRAQKLSNQFWIMKISWVTDYLEQKAKDDTDRESG